ncbi:MAG: gfo/Idh/MocA family oxidoreductase, partial [Planctomycetota bacterium]|nr:gfo/Idh/MocA family oxidoreductase [Planctomycetota bacterium]
MLTRRSFLQSAAAVTAIPALLTRSARAVSANERLTLGFIGVGTMGRYHLSALLGRNDVEVIGICDVVNERTQSAVEMV